MLRQAETLAAAPTPSLWATRVAIQRLHPEIPFPHHPLPLPELDSWNNPVDGKDGGGRAFNLVPFLLFSPSLVTEEDDRRMEEELVVEAVTGVAPVIVADL